MPARPRFAAFAVAAAAKIHNPTPGVSGGVDQGAYESKGNAWIRKTYVSATYDAAMPPCMSPRADPCLPATRSVLRARLHLLLLCSARSSRR
jgi:hypothetical protein